MKDLKQFNTELKQKNLAGYWETAEAETYRQPASSFKPCLWKSKDIHDAITQAGEVVGLEMVSRRVIRLCSPDKGTTAHTFQFNIQMLQPGEHAVAHRHTQAGVRFVVKGKGALCVVEGEAFDMAEGDFLTNPNWTWHEHINNSDQPVLWIDALDSPLMRFLEVGFHEPHETGKQAIAKSAGTTIAELSSIRPTWIKSDSVHPPGYRYRWADTEAALKVFGGKAGRSLRRGISGIRQSAKRRSDPADDVLRDPAAAPGRKDRLPPSHELHGVSCVSRGRVDCHRQRSL